MPTKAARLEALRLEPRHGDASDDDGNYVGGLIDLIEYARPRTVLEIGSHEGVSTEAFLLHCKQVMVVDPWPVERHRVAFWQRCIEYGNLLAVRGSSPEALSRFADGMFDLVYIDGEHFETSVVTDIEASRRLATKWLSGHDWNQPSVRAAVRKTLGEPERVFSDTSWIVPLMRCRARV